MSNRDSKPRINSGYVLDQLNRALKSTGKTAGARATQWRRVIAGIIEGTLRHGSRTPVADTPAWVTLEVAHGGFATGQFQAAGPLQRHEIEQLRLVERSASITVRAALNTYFLSDAGRADLRERLRSGHYRIRVPEEAALLAVTWLIDREEADRAEAVLEEISPFFDQLRFYPVPAHEPPASGDRVYVQSAATVVASLWSKRPKPAISAMKEAINVWTPLYDRAVELFIETVDGETPHLATTETGELRRRPDGSPIVEGGWPCRRFAENWAGRGRALLDEYARARSEHHLSRKPDKPKENFARLRAFLARAVEDTQALTERDVGAVRKILASYVTKHGAPGSDRLATTRAQQIQNAALPDHHELAHLLVKRIQARPTEGGLPDIDKNLVPVTDDEARECALPSGSVLPPSLVAKALRCLEAPIETLLARGILRSSEGIAVLLPHLSAQVRASAIADPELRVLYESVYRSFRLRRSLLLLDLESQVRSDELPWIAAIAPWVGSNEESRKGSRDAMAKAARLALESFPQTILPNKLVRELRALAWAAELRMPLVDELAADIFMGAFSEKYLRSAQSAARLLGGTLYERYYDLPLERVLALNDVQKTRYGTPESPGFAALCAERSRVETADRWSVARNGAIVEQSQILTTHNLVQLIGGLELAEEMKPVLPDLARRCFEWICRRRQLVMRDWHAEMQNVKNCAYAWRQMILFLSLAGADETGHFLEWAQDHLAKQGNEFRERFAPAMIGLEAAVSTRPFDRDGFDPRTGGRRFLGWTLERHWLLPPRREASPGATTQVI